MYVRQVIRQAVLVNVMFKAKSYISRNDYYVKISSITKICKCNLDLKSKVFTTWLISMYFFK